jgi:cell division protein FtsZ
VDFEDVNTVMRDSGVAIMGTSMAEGEDRARQAVDQALHSPLLQDNDIRGARHILLNITSGTREVTMDEIFEITEFVQEEAGYGTDLIWGNCYDESLGEKISVTVIATGFENKNAIKEDTEPKRVVVNLDDDESRPSGPTLSQITSNEELPNEGPAVFEFDSPRSRNYRPRNETPDYLSDEQAARREAEQRRREEMEAQRRKAAANPTVLPKLNNPNVINELESEPAYMRRNIHLDDVPHSDREQMSRWTISDEEEPELRSNNTYLHDRVD